MNPAAKFGPHHPFPRNRLQDDPNSLFYISLSRSQRNTPPGIDLEGEGQALAQKEMQVLLEELFSCEVSNVTPGGNPTYIEFKQDYLERMFGR